MPYTKTELESGTVEFYDKFINKLRRTYLNRLAGLGILESWSLKGKNYYRLVI